MFVPSLQNIPFLSTGLQQKRGDFASDYGDTVHRQMYAQVGCADLPTAVSPSSDVLIVMKMLIWKSFIKLTFCEYNAPLM
jgi:hypothetical protein